MSELWNEWAAHFHSLGIDEGSITRDGVADETAYRNAKPRVVFVPKDSNAWPGHSLSEAMVPKPIRMMIMVARWAHGLLNDFPPLETADRLENQIAAIRQVAVVNLKKAAGGPRCGTVELRRFAKQDAALLTRQIVMLAPDIMVACGTWEPLLSLLGCKEIAAPRLRNVLRDPGTGALVVSLRHPAMANKVKTYEMLRDLVHEGQSAIL